MAFEKYFAVQAVKNDKGYIINVDAPHPSAEFIYGKVYDEKKHTIL